MSTLSQNHSFLIDHLTEILHKNLNQREGESSQQHLRLYKIEKTSSFGPI